MANLKFQCPNCGSDKIGSVEQVFATYPIKSISADGTILYDYKNVKMGDEGEVVAFQCLDCGTDLVDENGDTIVDKDSLIKYLKQ